MTTMLLVEDNDMNRDMLSHRLQRRGYEVILAEDGAEGIKTTRSQSPDLIRMDLSLPVLDGWEATRQLKASPKTRSIPIPALTSHAMSGDRNRALEVGCDDYDTKSIAIERLIAKLEALLGK